MKKKAASVFLSFIIAAGTVTPALAEQITTIKVDGLKQVNSTSVINIGGYYFMGMRDVFTMLGADVDWNKYKRVATAEKSDTLITVDLNNNTVTVNDEVIDLPVSCRIIDGSIYVPLRFVAEAMDCDVDWDAESLTVSIDTKEDGEYILLQAHSEPEEDVKVYTYEEALAMALKDSSQLETIEDSSRYLKELREDLGQNLKLLDLQEASINSSTLDPTKTTDELLAFQLSLQENMENIVTMARNIKNVDMQRGMIDTNKEMASDAVEISLISCLNTIEQTETQIEVLEASIELGKENIENLKLKNQLGYVGDYAYTKAVNDQKKSELNLETLKITLDNNKQALNRLLGLPLKENIKVIYNQEMKSLDDFDLEPFIMKQRESAPTIKVLKNNVELAEYTEKTNPAMLNEMTLSVQNDLKDAGRKLEDGKDDLEKNIRNCYNNIEMLKQQDKNLRLAVDMAVDDYNSAVASYQAGNLTLFEVKQAKLGVLSAEKSVEDNLLSYNTAVYTLEKPYLLG